MQIQNQDGSSLFSQSTLNHFSFYLLSIHSQFVLSAPTLTISISFNPLSKSLSSTLTPISHYFQQLISQSLLHKQVCFSTLLVLSMPNCVISMLKKVLVVLHRSHFHYLLYQQRALRLISQLCQTLLSLKFKLLS